MLCIHESIKKKLSYFQSIHKIPNIIFHGPSGSGKRTIVNEFIHNIYDNNKLLKPILSRFCEIYITEPNMNGTNINLYKYNIQQTFDLKEIKNQRIESLKKMIYKLHSSKKNLILEDLMNFSNQTYEKVYCGLDIMYLLENSKCFDHFLTSIKKYELLIAFNKVRKEFRNEKLFILFILHFIFLDIQTSLENFSFM